MTDVDKVNGGKAAHTIYDHLVDGFIAGSTEAQDILTDPCDPTWRPAVMRALYMANLTVLNSMTGSHNDRLHLAMVLSKQLQEGVMEGDMMEDLPPDSI